MVLSAAAVLPARAGPLSISLRTEDTWSGPAQQLRISGRGKDAAFQALARRTADGGAVRWSTVVRRSAGRWILGSVRGWNASRGSGWRDPLARRGERAPPAPTLGTGAVGVTFVGAGGNELRWVAGLGSGPRGGADGVLLGAWGAWSTGWQLEDGVPTAVGAWTPASLPARPRAELAARRGRTEARLGLGGGRDLAGAVLEAVAGRGRSTDWRGEVGVRTAPAGTVARFRAALRRTRGVVGSDLSVEWERSRRGGGVRIGLRRRTRGATRRTGGVETTLTSAPARRVRLALRAGFGGPRDRRFLSWSASHGGRAARWGLRLEAPARTPRRGSAWIAVQRSGGRSVRLAVEWRDGRAPSLSLTCGVRGGGH